MKTGKKLKTTKKTVAERLERDGFAKFWVVSLSNGTSSKAFDSFVDTFDWLLDHVDENIISGILIQRKWKTNKPKGIKVKGIASPRKGKMAVIKPPKTQKLNKGTKIIVYKGGT
jgi:hypothetical protein